MRNKDRMSNNLEEE